MQAVLNKNNSHRCFGFFHQLTQCLHLFFCLEYGPCSTP